MVDEDYLIEFLKDTHPEVYEDAEIWKLQEEVIKKLEQLKSLKELYLDVSNASIFSAETECVKNLLRYFEDIK